MKQCFLFVLITCSHCLWAADTLTAKSPSDKISVKVWPGEKLHYSISYGSVLILEPSAIDMELDNGRTLSGKLGIKSVTLKKFSEEIVSPVPEKRKKIKDNYNLLSISFKQPFTIEFRVYDDGVAYRILTRFRDSITVINETADFHFPGKPAAWFPKVQLRADADIYHTSFEEEYPLRNLDSIETGTLGYNPILVANGNAPKIGITESDLEDYPGMFLEGTSSPLLKARFAPYPAEEVATEGIYKQKKVTRRAAFIARTRGTRSFPWRVLLVSATDKELPGNDLVYRLGAPSRVSDVSWITPGNLTDEWIIDINLFNVPFRAGVNTASYKYYIDFAKKFGFDRIMLDAGWSDNDDLFKITPGISIDTLVAYAKEQGVKLSMRTLGMTLERQLDSALAQFNKWGVDFIMTDFIDRDDQKAVNLFHRVAKACAEHKIMIMYHGAFPPKGFNRTYPNAVAREGVLGSEFNMWSNRLSPAHDVTLAYTRMLAGYLDYEPGLLNNATVKGTRPVAGVVTSPGARCHQLSMFLIYDCPMQIFSGNPSEGMREPEFMKFLGSLPTTWDETVILDGKVSEYIVTARKKNNDWYVGGMNDWTPRDQVINFDFLEVGEYTATVCKDGINSDRYAADYLIEDTVIKKGDKLSIHLAPGGGFAIRLVKK